jgi:hypothetical protein
MSDVRFEALVAVLLKIQVFLYVVLCQLKKNGR